MDYTNYKAIQVIKTSDKAEVIFAAVDGLDKPVVVKRLFDANSEIYRVIEGIRNIHIPQIYCVEERDSELFVAEEYIDGRTLDVYLKEEVLSDVQKLALMVQLCEALEVLHGCNPPVIHRDIKPSNILVNEDGVLKIIDFDASRQYKGTKNTSDTRLLGTIEYAAPEQFGYAQTDFRSDIYSVGVVFSEIQIGENATFTKEWKRLVDKCTSFDPANRYKDVPELKKDLLKCLQKAKQPVTKRWIIPTAAGVVLCGGLLGGGMLLHQGKDAGVSKTGPTMPVSYNVEKTDVTKSPNLTNGPEFPEPTKVTEGIVMDGTVLVEDRLAWTETALPVSVKVYSGALCGIKEVYFCEQAETDDPFSETLYPVAEAFYEVAKGGKELQLGASFFEEYGKRGEIVLYIEFDDGRGERLWLTHA